MKILKRVLYLDALVTFLVGLAVAVVPRTVVETMLDQPPLVDDAWLRLAGVGSIVLAMFMVLVGHRIEDLWWWSWGFVVLEAGTAAVATFHALFGVPAGGAVWPWWLMAAVWWLFAIGFLWGLARTGLERPPT